MCIRDSNKVYVAAVGAFLASGGDDHKALAGGIQISNSGLLVADVLKAYLKKKSPISQTPVSYTHLPHRLVVRHILIPDLSVEIEGPSRLISE